MVNHVMLVGKLILQDKDNIVLEVDDNVIEVKFDDGYLTDAKNLELKENTVIGVRGKITNKGVLGHAITLLKEDA